jgi:hypothetical protein
LACPLQSGRHARCAGGGGGGRGGCAPAVVHRRRVVWSSARHLFAHAPPFRARARFLHIPWRRVCCSLVSPVRPRTHARPVQWCCCRLRELGRRRQRGCRVHLWPGHGIMLRVAVPCQHLECFLSVCCAVCVCVCVCVVSAVSQGSRALDAPCHPPRDACVCVCVCRVANAPAPRAVLCMLWWCHSLRPRSSGARGS